MGCTVSRRDTCRAHFQSTAATVRDEMSDLGQKQSLATGCVLAALSGGPDLLPLAARYTTRKSQQHSPLGQEQRCAPFPCSLPPSLFR
jgi:hypothetical protein